jgi:hypothetical protein
MVDPSLKLRALEFTLATGSARSLSTTLFTVRCTAQASLIHGVASPADAYCPFPGDRMGRPSTAPAAA